MYLEQAKPAGGEALQEEEGRGGEKSLFDPTSMREDARLCALVEATATSPNITAAIPAAARSRVLFGTCIDGDASKRKKKKLFSDLGVFTEIMARGWGAVSAAVLCLGALGLLCAHYGGGENVVELQEETPKALPVAFAEEAEKYDPSAKSISLCCPSLLPPSASSGPDCCGAGPGSRRRSGCRLQRLSVIRRPRRILTRSTPKSRLKPRRRRRGQRGCSSRGGQPHRRSMQQHTYAHAAFVDPLPIASGFGLPCRSQPSFNSIHPHSHPPPSLSPFPTSAGGREESRVQGREEQGRRRSARDCSRQEAGISDGLPGPGSHPMRGSPLAPTNANMPLNYLQCGSARQSTHSPRTTTRKKWRGEAHPRVPRAEPPRTRQAPCRGAS